MSDAAAEARAHLQEALIRLRERRFISPTELAAQLGVSPASALRACRDGRVRSVRFGKRFLIPIDEVERLLKGDAA
jgi:excisionase family DNA binding protein